MNNITKNFALFGSALSLAGCVTIGHNFDLAAANQLTPRVSTEADAQYLLGEPISIGHNPQNNHDLFIWQYTYGTGIGTASSQSLAISFDENQKMIAIISRTKI